MQVTHKMFDIVGTIEKQACIISIVDIRKKRLDHFRVSVVTKKGRKRKI